MRAADLVEQAQRERALGRDKVAVRRAWEAVQAAMYAQDEGPVRDVQVLAREVAAETEGRVRSDAEQLASYCAALLAGVGGGVSAPGFLERVLGGGRRAKGDERRPCPECAESIKVDASVCRFCGHRFAPPAG